MIVVSSELLSELRSSLASIDDSESDEYLLYSTSVLRVFVACLTRVLFLRLIAFFDRTFCFGSVHVCFCNSGTQGCIYGTECCCYLAEPILGYRFIILFGFI